MGKPTGKLIRVTPEGIGAVATSSVVQSTGTSTTDVMSQKAVTDYSAKRTLYSEEVDGSAVVKTPSGNASLQLSYNGWLNILSKDGEATLSFSPVGIMHVGTIPVERLSGYIRGIGDGQDWKVVTDQRKGGVTYKNPFDRTITVSVTVLVSAPNTAPVYMRSNDKVICSVSTSTDPFIRQVITVPIGPRATYGLFSSKEVRIEHWAEMTE